jgi:hypothetical protein
MKMGTGFRWLMIAFSSDRSVVQCAAVWTSEWTSAGIWNWGGPVVIACGTLTVASRCICAPSAAKLLSVPFKVSVLAAWTRGSWDRMSLGTGTSAVSCVCRCLATSWRLAQWAQLSVSKRVGDAGRTAGRWTDARTGLQPPNRIQKPDI